MGSIFFSFLKMLVFIVSDSNVRESLSIAKQDNTWEFVMRCVRLQRMRPFHIAFIRSPFTKKTLRSESFNKVIRFPPLLFHFSTHFREFSSELLIAQSIYLSLSTTQCVLSEYHGQGCGIATHDIVAKSV
jgi:hypothetical protein